MPRTRVILGLLVGILSACTSIPPAKDVVSDGDVSFSDLLDGANLQGFELGGTPLVRHGAGPGAWIRRRPGAGLLRLEARARADGKVVVVEGVLATGLSSDGASSAQAERLVPGRVVAWTIRPNRSDQSHRQEWNTVVLHATDRPGLYVALEGSGARWGAIRASRPEDLELIDARPWPAFEQAVLSLLDSGPAETLERWLQGDSPKFLAANSALAALRSRVERTLGERERALRERERAAARETLVGEVRAAPLVLDPFLESGRHGLALVPARRASAGHLYDEVYAAELPSLRRVLVPAVLTELFQVQGAWFGRHPEIGPALCRVLDGKVVETPFVRLVSDQGAFADSAGNVYETDGTPIFAKDEWPLRPSQRTLADDSRNTACRVQRRVEIVPLRDGLVFVYVKPDKSVEPLLWRRFRSAEPLGNVPRRAPPEWDPDGHGIGAARWRVVRQDGFQEILRFPEGVSTIGAHDEIVIRRINDETRDGRWVSVWYERKPDGQVPFAYAHQLNWWCFVRDGATWTAIEAPAPASDKANRDYMTEPEGAEWVSNGIYGSLREAMEDVAARRGAAVQKRNQALAEAVARAQPEIDAEDRFQEAVRAGDFAKAAAVAASRGGGVWALRKAKYLGLSWLRRIAAGEVTFREDLVDRRDEWAPPLPRDGCMSRHPGLAEVEESLRCVSRYLSCSRDARDDQESWSRLGAVRLALGGDPSSNQFDALRFPYLPTTDRAVVEAAANRWLEVYRERERARTAKEERWKQEAAARAEAAWRADRETEAARWAAAHATAPETPTSPMENARRETYNSYLRGSFGPDGKTLKEIRYLQGR